MGFGENGNGMGPADFAALLGNNGNNGNNNNGDGLFGGGSYWVIVLIILMVLCGGFGNNGAGNLLPYMMMSQGGGGSQAPAPASVYAYESATQRGFDQAAIMGAVEGVRSAVTQGNADNALGLAGLGQVVTNGFSQAEIAANSRQMASMNQDFNGQIAMMQGFNNMGSKFDASCCENRLGIAQLGADVAREACSDRQAVSEGLMALTAQNNQNTNTIVNAINNVGQDLKDQIFAQQMSAKDDTIAQLRQENLYARGQASQVAQNGQIVDAIYNRLSQCPVGTTPVYGQTPIFTCNQNPNNQGCPCGGNF